MFAANLSDGGPDPVCPARVNTLHDMRHQTNGAMQHDLLEYYAHRGAGYPNVPIGAVSIANRLI
jgi:hypothetical protein